MWCDILTKAKQGSTFRKFRGHLMNVPQDYDDDAERLSTYAPLPTTKAGGGIRRNVNGRQKCLEEDDQQYFVLT